MMAGFLTPKQTTEEIVASVLDDIICDVERKAKPKGKEEERQVYECKER